MGDLVSIGVFSEFLGVDWVFKGVLPSSGSKRARRRVAR
jgi:hypothetical protein